MELEKVRKVGIIGAGVAGLSTAKLLLAQGLDCTVFERGPNLGGVWTIGYSNFGVQVQKELYEFPDWPLPEDGPDFTPGPVVQRYLEEYARHFGVWPNIRFRTTVSHLRERAGDEPGWIITYNDAGTIREDDFDLVAFDEELLAVRGGGVGVLQTGAERNLEQRFGDAGRELIDLATTPAKEQ